MDKQPRWVLLACLLCLSAKPVAAGAFIASIVCIILLEVLVAVNTIGPTLVLLMFTYGGVKYVFSADDPNGRKAGKMTCIHAIIGGIILMLAAWVATLFGTGCV